MSDSPEEGLKAQQRWAWAGKALTGLAALAAVVAVAFQLYDRFMTGPDLNARVSSYEYAYAPEFAANSEEAIPQDDLLIWTGYKGYHVMRIGNDGGAQAENVKVMLPYAGVARISTEAGKPRELRFNQSIFIGVIAPTEVVTLQLWTRDPPSTFNEDKFRITHKAGVADIIFLHETDGWWRTLGRALFSVSKLLLFLLGILAAAVFASDRLAKWDESRKPRS